MSAPRVLPATPGWGFGFLWSGCCGKLYPRIKPLPHKRKTECTEGKKQK